MPRSVLEIEVRDEKFKAFMGLYEKYQAELGKMKNIWDSTGESIKKAGDTLEEANFTDLVEPIKESASAAGELADAFAAGVVAATAISDVLNKSQPAMEKTFQTAKNTETSWSNIASHAKSVGGSVLSVGASLAKFAVFGLGAGLAGIGGSLFGLDALAGGASNQLRQSTGLGVSAGEMNSFNTNLGRLVDPSMLGNVQGAQQDNRQWAKFAQMGISPEQFQNMDPAQLSALIISRVHKLIHPGNGVPLAQQMQVAGLTGIMSQDDVNRILNTSQSNVSSDISQFQSGIGSMGANQQTLTAWQQFQVNLDSAGKEIETVLIKGLVPLIGPLGQLSKSIETALGGFLASPGLQIWIQDFSKGIQSLAKYLGSPEFLADMQTFATDVGDVALGIVSAMKTLGIIKTQLPPGALDDSKIPSPYDRSGGVLKYWGQSLTGQIGAGYDLGPIARAHGLTKAELTAIAQIESGFDKNAYNPKTGAAGLLQLMPATARALGVTDPMDPAQSAAGGATLLQQYLQKYQGNIAESVAAYDGDTHLDSDIKKYGQNGWLKHAPQETQNYLAQLVKIMTQLTGQKVSLQILNQTGAQVSMLANATRQ